MILPDLLTIAHFLTLALPCPSNDYVIASISTRSAEEFHILKISWTWALSTYTCRISAAHFPVRIWQQSAVLVVSLGHLTRCLAANRLEVLPGSKVRQGWKPSIFLLAALCCKGVWNTFSGVFIANWLHVAMTPERNLKTFKLGRTRTALDVPMTSFGNLQNGRGILPETNSYKGLKRQVCREGWKSFASSMHALRCEGVPNSFRGVLITNWLQLAIVLTRLSWSLGRGRLS